MFHVRGGGKKLNVLWVGAATLLFLSIFAVHVTYAGHSPILSGGKVTPENGAWDSAFTFEVVFRDPSDVMPAGGYPKIYIDGETQGREMVENDPADNDITDGKLYRYEWPPDMENDRKTPLFEDFEVNNRYPDPGENVIFSGYLIDNHNFYFYVKNLENDNARDPETGAYSGPTVAVSGRTVTLLLIEMDNSVVGSDNTDENGYFSISIEAPDSGSFAYRAEFEGDTYHESSQSVMECLITFDALSISGISTVFSVVLILALMLLLSRGISRAQYLWPVLIGFLVATIFTFIFMAGVIGWILAGVVAGYMYARKVRGWSKHLRVGALVALFLLLILCLLRGYFIKETAAIYILEWSDRSISNSELLELIIFETIISTLFYIIYIGVGAVLGGLLRKLLKPAEHEPVTGPGYYRTERPTQIIYS
jgi:hypothetical protein